MAIVYDYLIEIGDEGILSVPVTNDFARVAGFEEHELFERAKENTRRLFPTKIQPMSNIIAELMGMETMPFDLKQAIEQDIQVNQPMFVITNEHKHKGAGALLFEEDLQELATYFGSSFYLLPSSIHESIAVPDELMTPLELASMVEEINQMEVEIGDRLSNQVYYYDQVTRKVTMATDTPNKSLDNQNEHHDFEVTRGPVR